MTGIVTITMHTTVPSPIRIPMRLDSIHQFLIPRLILIPKNTPDTPTQNTSAAPLNGAVPDASSAMPSIPAGTSTAAYHLRWDLFISDSSA
jgi:hypothetical protein